MEGIGNVTRTVYPAWLYQCLASRDANNVVDIPAVKEQWGEATAMTAAAPDVWLDCAK